MKAYNPESFRLWIERLRRQEANIEFECLTCGSAVDLPNRVSLVEAYQEYILPCRACGKLDKEVTHSYDL